MQAQGKAERLRRNWGLAGGTVAATLAGLLLAANGSAFVGVPVAAFALFFGTLCVVRDAFPASTTVTYRISADGLSLDDETIALADILEAKVTPLHATSTLELTLRDRRVVRLRLLTHRVGDFAQLLQSRRARFRLASLVGKRFLGSSLLCLLFFGIPLLDHSGVLRSQAVTVLVGSLVTALLPTWLLGFFRGRIVIGTDGFATRWFFRERFVPFSEVVAVTPKNQLLANHLVDAIVELDSGEELRLRAVETPNTEAERGVEGRALFTHLAVAFERSKQQTSALPDVRGLVERGARSEREWLSGIDALVGGGGGGYRIASLSNDALFAVATDAAAPTEARVGAAAALVRTSDEDLRVRVRVYAESCTDRAISDAMLALSEARDDEATEAALASIRR